MGASTGHVSRKYCDQWTIAAQIQTGSIAFFFSTSTLSHPLAICASSVCTIDPVKARKFPQILRN